MAARIIPVGYILSDEAIEEIVTSNPECARLLAEWQQASGEAKASVHEVASGLQDRIHERIFSAVRSRELPAVALVRNASGHWIEHDLPPDYLSSIAGDMALFKGSVDPKGLHQSDRWIGDAPLCFRRREFDAWRQNMPPNPLDGPTTWWTVPQASVWIATRERTKVQLLHDKACASLFVASELVPGAFQASYELLAGLRDGRLLARGWVRGTAQARALGPEIAQGYWKEPTEFSDMEHGVEAVRGPGNDARVGLLVDADDVMSRWESPQSLLDGDRIPLGVAIGRLMHEDWPGYLLRHSEVVVTGLNDRGARVEIDKDVFQTDATVDRNGHSVTTADGRLHWSAVMVELRKEPEAKASPPAKQDGKQLIAFAKAERRVHRSLCGEETIAGLTSRERWLVTLDFLDASDKGVTDEWQEAVNKDDLWRHQCDEVDAWLKARGLVASNDGMLDRTTFEKALAAAFAVPVEGARLPTVAPEPVIAKDSSITPKQRELVEWGTKVCALLRDAGKRIARGAFISIAWERFGTSSGLTADGIVAAWPKVRRSAGWPDSGSILKSARIDDDALRTLLIEADLLKRKDSAPNN